MVLPLPIFANGLPVKKLVSLEIVVAVLALLEYGQSMIVMSEVKPEPDTHSPAAS